MIAEIKTILSVIDSFFKISPLIKFIEVICYLEKLRDKIVQIILVQLKIGD